MTVLNALVAHHGMTVSNALVKSTKVMERKHFALDVSHEVVLL